MADSVSGVVTNILGGDTFEMKVTNQGVFNENDYHDPERIRVAGIDDPDLYPGHIGHDLAKLKDKKVQCFVLARDPSGNAVAVVQCLK